MPVSTCIKVLSKSRVSTLFGCWVSVHWMSRLNCAFQHCYSDRVLPRVSSISVGFSRNLHQSLPVHTLRCYRSFGSWLHLVVEYQSIEWVDWTAHFNIVIPIEFCAELIQCRSDLAEICTIACQYMHWGATAVSGLVCLLLLSIGPCHELTEWCISTWSCKSSIAQSFINFRRI